MYTRRRADVNWSYGTLVTPKTPDEPASLGTDDSIAALLDEAEDVVNQAGREIMADLEKEKRRFGGRLRRSVRRRGRDRGGLD